MDQAEIGRQLRARRTAAGRTVASVASDAGLSVPYIANLENGRGNPTTAALTRLAEALGLRLVVTLAPAEEDPGTAGSAVAGSAVAGLAAGLAAGTPEIPASLVRLGRTDRFREAVAVMAPALDAGPDEFAGQLVAVLAALAQAMGRDLAEPDWWRLLDALVLVAAHPFDSRVTHVPPAPHSGRPESRHNRNDVTS